jgi:hypothetical protein
LSQRSKLKGALEAKKIQQDMSKDLTRFNRFEVSWLCYKEMSLVLKEEL